MSELVFFQGLSASDYFIPSRSLMLIAKFRTAILTLFGYSSFTFIPLITPINFYNKNVGVENRSVGSTDSDST